MKDIIKHILVALLCIAASACADKTEDPQVAELPISVSVSLPQTKASIFDTQASLINSEIGGGNMIVSAYVTDGEDKGARHIDNVRVTYFADAKDWRFTNAAGAYVNYYWPKHRPREVQSSIRVAKESWGFLSSDCRANRPHLGLCPEASVPLQGR